MLVSVLIPCFNNAQWVGHAIESALSQTWRDVEVIVVDDGSTDGSLEQIKRYGRRIRWETQPNQGSNPTRNRLLGMARGSWLQYLDADDYLLEDKIRRQAEVLAGRDNVDVIYGPVTLEFCGDHAPRRELLPIPEPHDPWILLARWYLPQTGAPLWRKQAMVDVGGWTPTQAACQEHELYLRLLMAGKTLKYFDADGAIYRQWSEATLWKRDQSRTRRLRLDILQRLEDFLRASNRLTPPRHHAISQSRFEMARLAWVTDPEEGRCIVDQLKQSDHDFVPNGAAAPWTYQVLFQWLGFDTVERIAAWRRRISGRARS